MTEENDDFIWELVAGVINEEKPKAMTGEACKIIRESQETLAGSVELVNKYREHSSVYDISALMKEIPANFLKKDEIVEALFNDLPLFETGNYTGSDIFPAFKGHFLLNNIDTLVIPVLDACINDDMLSQVLMISFLPDEMVKNESVCKKLQEISKICPETKPSERIMATGLLEKFYSYYDAQPTLQRTVGVGEIPANSHQ